MAVAFLVCPESFPVLLSVWKTGYRAGSTRAPVSREIMEAYRRLHLHKCWLVCLVTSRFMHMDGCTDKDAQTGSTMRSRDGGSLQRVLPPALALTLSVVQGRQQDPPRFATGTAEMCQKTTHARIHATAGRRKIQVFARLHPCPMARSLCAQFIQPRFKLLPLRVVTDERGSLGLFNS